MNIQELRKEPHLSASGLKDYMECGLLYKFSRVDGIKPEYRSDALEFGSTIHKVLAELYQQRMIGDIPAIEDLQSSFEKLWQESAGGKTDIKYSAGKSFEILLHEGKELIKTYYGNVPQDDFRVLAIEEPFRFSMRGSTIIDGKTMEYVRAK